jgi:predicted nucleic acid-binding protein
MDWIDAFRGRKIALDSAIIIYFIEEHPAYLPFVQPLFQNIARGHIKAVTSTVTLLEVLVRPLREGNVSLANRYRDILLYSENLETLPLSHPLSERAAELRARYRLRAPDVIQIATALGQKASAIITNDERWRRIKELDVVILEDLLSA